MTRVRWSLIFAAIASSRAASRPRVNVAGALLGALGVFLVVFSFGPLVRERLRQCAAAAGPVAETSPDAAACPASNGAR